MHQNYCCQCRNVICGDRDGRIVWGYWLCMNCIAEEYGYYDDNPGLRPPRKTKYKVDIEELGREL